MSKRIPRYLLERESSSIPNPPKIEIQSSNTAKAVFSFERFHHNDECPSTWEREEIRQLFATFGKASDRTWQQITETGGHPGGGKIGLGFTEFKNSSLPFKWPAWLSADKTISEMRVNDRARIFGFRQDHIYYIFKIARHHL